MSVGFIMSRIHKLSLFVHTLKKVKMNKKLLPVRELFYAMTAKSVYYKHIKSVSAKYSRG